MKYDRLKENIEILSMHNERHTPVYHITDGAKHEIDLIREIVADCSEILNKIEHGTLKEINYPWHVGDKVFVVRSATRNNKNFYIFEDTVVQTCVYKNVEANTYWLFIKLMENTSVLEWDFDKVFLTREEAEKRLKELQKL